MKTVPEEEEDEEVSELTMKMGVQAPIGDVVIDEQLLILSVIVSS